MLANKLLSTVGSDEKLYSDDVFSTYLYTGNGSTQTITNGIDLAGNGGLVWIKGRSAAQQHMLQDTARGIGNYLQSNATTQSQLATDAVTSVSTSGFSIGNSSLVNTSANTYASWTFARATKFFDVVTYTGNGVAGRTIPHALGVAPGMIVVKRTDSIGNWITWHRVFAQDGTYIVLNDVAAATPLSPAPFTTTVPNASNFYVNAGTGNYFDINLNGATYVAYLFAHDASTDGIIQCGSFTTDGAGNATVNLGWEPQYLMFKCSDQASTAWYTFDQMRGFLAKPATNSSFLSPNSSGAEGSISATVAPSASGFEVGAINASKTFVYLAIRRPNKPPTTGTQVYNAIARTGTGTDATVTGVGFPPDLAFITNRDRVASSVNSYQARLTGSTYLNSNATTAESAHGGSGISFGIDGMTFPGSLINNGNSYPYINHFFKRAPGVFDVVCYTGTGSATTVAHSLEVVPELMIVKRRNLGYGWIVYAQSLGASNVVLLNATQAITSYPSGWNSTAPTASIFNVGTAVDANESSGTYVCYLFATKAGISKVGSYTGNGGTQTVNCGFSTGARFVLIKSTSTTGNWTVIDTARGLVAGSDPYLALNTTAAEVTGEDCVDPDGTGFVVNTTAAALNTNGVTYIYLAFA